jgi:hypothetical protein
MTELDAAKFHLIYRDKLYNRNKLANSFEYLGGSLDNYVIGKMFKNIVNCDFDQVENTRAIEFDKSKIDFKKESLGPFIFWAFEELQKS